MASDFIKALSGVWIMTIIPQTGKAAVKGVEKILLILLEKGVLDEQEYHSVLEAMLKAGPKEFDGENL